MVEYKVQHLNQVFHALADPTRRQLLHSIAKQSVCNVTELAAPFSISLNAISKHLKILERAKLIKRQKKGRIHYFVFERRALKEATKVINQLEQYWEARLDALENHFKAKKIGE